MMLPLFALAPLIIPTNRPSPTSCQRPDGTSAPCGPGNDLCHSSGYGADAPQFHVRDQSCAMNDPAAVVYDPVVSARAVGACLGRLRPRDITFSNFL